MPVTLRLIQTGEVELPASQQSVTVTLPTPLLDKNKAFLIATASRDNNAVAGGLFTKEITDVNTLTFTMGAIVGSPVLIRWTVVEATAGMSVQHGLTTIDTGDVDKDVTIAAVDRTKTFALISIRYNGSTYATFAWVRASLPADTTLRLRSRFNASPGPTVAWQVVTYDDCAVQAGQVLFEDLDQTRLASLAPAVDLAKSWLITSYDADNTPDITNLGRAAIRGRLTAGNQATFDRGPASGAFQTLEWFVVAFTGAERVQHLLETFGAAETQRTPAIPQAIDPAKAFAVTTGAYGQYGRAALTTGDNNGPFTMRAHLTGATAAQFDRASTGSVAMDVAVEVVEFDVGEPEPPGPGQFPPMLLRP